MVIQTLKSFLDKDKEGCLAVVESDPTKLCGNDIYGVGCAKGQRVRYCKEHVPSEACVTGGRIDPVTFYDPKNDTYIEVE